MTSTLSRRKFLVGGAVALSAVSRVRPARAAGWIGDAAVHAPPTSGPYPYSPPYGTFYPGQAGFPAAGAAYVDPIFGNVIRRLTNDVQTSGGNIYSRNGFWNADATYFVHTFADQTVAAVHALTGALKSLTTGLPADASCSPVSPDVYYYFQGQKVYRQLISTGVAIELRDFGATLGSLGGSLDNIDNTDTYMLLCVGTQSYRVWNRVTDTLYTGAITDGFGSGSVSMAPNGAGVIFVGQPNVKRWHALNHSTHTLDPTGVSFSTWAGDHVDISGPTDGATYMIYVDVDNVPAVMKRTNVLTGATAVIYTFPADAYWTGNVGHISCPSLGTWRDWVFMETDLAGGPTLHDDDFTAPDPVATWGKFQGEIGMVNVLTGEVRRLAHHRSRQVLTAYTYSPRVCASWDGRRVAWASNMGYRSSPDGYADIYTMDTPGAARLQGITILSGAAAIQ